MSDTDFIIFLCEEIHELWAGGNDTPSFDKIIDELRLRGIDPNEIFYY